MASKDAIKFSLRSTYEYVNSLGKKVTSATEYMVKRNPRKQPEKLEFMKYDPVATNTARDIFQIIGPGVQVLSENELLAARGRRVHTGQSDELNRRFASRFTAVFEQLSRKFPIYAELKNLFDLALVVALLETEGIFERVGWQQGLLLDSHRLRLPAVVTPKHVETIINHRVIRGRHILAGVSGGVWLDTNKSLRLQKMNQTAESATDRSRAVAPNANEERIWWWD